MGLTATGASGHVYSFTDPVPLQGAVVPILGGVYAISVCSSPKVHHLLYVGQAHRFVERGITTGGHHAAEHWRREAVGRQLFVSFFQMPLASERRRREVEADIQGALDPPCNQRFDFKAALRAFRSASSSMNAG